MRAARCGFRGPGPPQANAFVERRMGGLRRELLDRILIVNARRLRCVPAAYDEHRPHRSPGQAAPLRALPGPVEDDIEFIRRDRLRQSEIGHHGGHDQRAGAPEGARGDNDPASAEDRCHHAPLVLRSSRTG
ncbi:integrase core domain-containing protein [Nonomuraea insulae]|uniref:Integrase core domain-containing protein n=1 Tax=Nonomuraea insulae TaxID=1616787 RepID=A0ABW1CQ90_9ACTN